MAKNLKDYKKQLKAEGVYYTDKKLAMLMREMLTVQYDEVYDPTCGAGSLLSVFPNEIRKYGQELDPEEAEKAAQLVNSTIVTGNTLKADGFIGKRFKAIVANPPFSIPWEQDAEDERFSVAPALAPTSNADYAFLLHILHHLDDGGQAITLNFPGILYRGNTEGKIREWLIRQGVISKVLQVHGDYFVDTKIDTALVVFDKTAFHSSITMGFLDGESRDVPLSEIESNGFNLSPSMYIQPKKEEKPPFDEYAAEMEARHSALARIKAEIEFSLMVSQLSGIDVKPFLLEIRNIVDSYM